MRVSLLALACFAVVPAANAQEVKPEIPPSPISHADHAHLKERTQWFYRGRVMRGQPSPEFRRRAYQAKLQLRARQASAPTLTTPNGAVSLSSGSWSPLGPAPLASDASGDGTQDYRQVAGRATAIAIDPADPTGNTIYIGGAQGGVWKSTNAANPTPNNVTWTALTDTQATLSIGAVAIQPGNNDPARSLILAATGEADNAGDSYFGLGILRSTDAGATWTLVRNANNGALSFSGLGGTRMAFSSAEVNTVVSAMATTSEGLVVGAVTGSTTRGLYTSLDAGQTWTFSALTDPGGATDATSATSVVYNASAGMFLAAVRYHGFYASADGTNWTRLVSQPGGAALNSAACPPLSTSNHRACPIYRGEITVLPSRNEMYAWYISLSPEGIPQDGGIWKSLDAGTSWTAVSGTGITNCGDTNGCGVEQGSYNLALQAVANGSATDLYAGAVNLYKCAMNSLNPACATSPFMNLTHVYGCAPAGAPAHVHPAQHAVAATIPTTGSDSGNALLYFANDGGIYRTLNGYSGLNSGACSASNQFDDLNQSLGSLAQFVSFSQHPTDDDTLLGGTQGNGSPATNHATTSFSWQSILGGDGGYNAIDPTATTNWYASNPDLPPGGLGIQLCSAGVSCNNSTFNFVVRSIDLGGDDGAFLAPYILDSRSSTAMLVGTCRVWRGPRTGGIFTALSQNFDTLGNGTCTGSEVNQVSALAAAGPVNADGSDVVYAATSGLGPLDGPLSTPAGGHIWVTKDASAPVPSFVDVTGNGPQGSINPNQFPISGVATDPTDLTGSTAYVTVMGFTGGAGHVWKTTNAGTAWTDFTANLPDSPVNAVVVYPALLQVYVGTDVGVFASSVSTPSWTELGPLPSTNLPGFLPNVAVTALGVFASGGQQILRASTYGRGMWQFNLVITPDFQLSVSNSPLTLFAGQTASFNGTITAVNGYTNSVTLSCVAGTTAPPSTCTPVPLTLTPNSKTPFTVNLAGAAGDYNFSVQAGGADINHLTHKVPVIFRVVNFGMTNPSPASISVGRGTTSSPVSFQVTAAGSFNQNVTVTCSTTIPNASCSLSPGATVNPTPANPVNMTASVTVPATTTAGSYPVTLQATTTGASSSLTKIFTLIVTSNPDFIFPAPPDFPVVNAGSSGTHGPITIASQDGFTGTVTLSCPTTYGAGSCSITPASVNSYPATATLTINGTSFVAGAYSLTITGTSGSVIHTLAVPFNVGDYAISGTETLLATPGSQASASLTLASSNAYGGKINATCDATALAGSMCTLTPANPVTVTSGGGTNLTATINIPKDAPPGVYSIKITTRDTTGAPSHSANVALTVAQDFVLSSSTPSQTVKPGQTSGAYNLRVQPVGSSFTGAVTLACTTGLPAGAQCNFSPSTAVTPGTSAVDVVMNISTAANRADAHRSSATSPPAHRWLFYAVWFLLPGVVVGSGASRRQRDRRKMHSFAGTTLMLLTMLAFAACSGVSSGGGGGTPPPPVTYHVTIAGSSPGTAVDAGHSVVVNLVVQ